MKDSRFSDFWQRLNDWIDGHEPEIHPHHENIVNEVRSTQEMEKEYHERKTASRGGAARGKTLLELYADWESGSGVIFFGRLRTITSVIICVAVITVLLLTVSFLPPFGNPGNPANNEVFVKYIADALRDTNATNVVAGIILDYRAFDTFGEATVLFIAACAVLILLRDDEREMRDPGMLSELNEPRHDAILTKVSMLIIPILVLYGIYVILNGHISPGGGFSGGTIIGSALILYLNAFGARQAGKLIGARTYTAVTFSALFFYALAKGYSFFTGANHIESAVPHGIPGAIFSGGLILPLNIAVGLVVACTMYGFYALFSKGEI